MIKKLRRKFAIINMSLVAVILCVVLGMFCFTRIHAFRAESPSRKKTCHICLNVFTAPTNREPARTAVMDLVLPSLRP